MDLALNHLQRLIWHKSQTSNHLFNCISTLVGCLMPKSFLLKTNLTNNWKDIEVCTFPKCINLKVNAIVRLGPELTYFVAVIKHVDYYTPYIYSIFLHMFSLYSLFNHSV